MTMTITHMTNTTVETVKATIDHRIEELRPLVAEFESLKQFRDHALNELLTSTPTNGNGATTPRPKRRRAHVKQQKNTPPTKLSMTDKVLATVKNHEDGVTIGEVAEEVRTATSYVYRIARSLEGEGKIKREDKRLIAA